MLTRYLFTRRLYLRSNKYSCQWFVKFIAKSFYFRFYWTFFVLHNRILVKPFCTGIVNLIWILQLTFKCVPMCKWDMLRWCSCLHRVAFTYKWHFSASGLWSLLFAWNYLKIKIAWIYSTSTILCHVLSKPLSWWKKLLWLFFI